MNRVYLILRCSWTRDKFGLICYSLATSARLRVNTPVIEVLPASVKILATGHTTEVSDTDNQTIKKAGLEVKRKSGNPNTWLSYLKAFPRIISAKSAVLEPKTPWTRLNWCLQTWVLFPLRNWFAVLNFFWEHLGDWWVGFRVSSIPHPILSAQYMPYMPTNLLFFINSWPFRYGSAVERLQLGDLMQFRSIVSRSQGAPYREAEKVSEGKRK